MNLQSNALKFTRESGKIKIIAEYVRAIGKPSWGNKKSQFYNAFESEEKKDDGSSESSNFTLELERQPEEVAKPTNDFDKLVITVIDTGIGIKKKDK